MGIRIIYVRSSNYMSQFNVFYVTMPQLCSVIITLKKAVMSQKINILYIGKHNEIMQTVVRLINNNENWNGMGTISYSEAKHLFVMNNPDIVLLGCGIDESNELDLREYFNKHNSSVKIVQHYGGGSGLLYNEIMIALAGGTTPNFLS